MRILLDARDLIDLAEHDRPLAVDNLRPYLHAGDHQIVLSYTNVRELAAPLAAGHDFLRIRPLLQSLEELAHTYIREVPIVAFEIESALHAYNSGTEYQGCSVYANRWDDTFTPPGQH